MTKRREEKVHCHLSYMQDLEKQHNTQVQGADSTGQTKEYMHIYQILTRWLGLLMSTVQGPDLLAGSIQPGSQTWLLTTTVTTNIQSFKY